MSTPTLIARESRADSFVESYKLSDVISCLITEERNGSFELELEYPIDGEAYEHIQLQEVIEAQYHDAIQRFRIYSISRPLSGVITVNAHQICYDWSGVVITPFNASSLAEACDSLSYFGNKQVAPDINTIFATVSADFSSSVYFKLENPTSFKSVLGGMEGSLLDVYGGEWEFKNNFAILHKSRGADNGVVVAYEKNLTSFQQDEECGEMYTDVFPYIAATDTSAAIYPTGSTKYASADGTYLCRKILAVDVTDDFGSPDSDDFSRPTDSQLIDAATSYIWMHNIGAPTVSLDASYIQESGIATAVKLCDTVTVRFPRMGVETKAKIVSLTYNSLLERVEDVTLGSLRANITDTIATIQKNQ